jgi:hypothetical protein
VGDPPEPAPEPEPEPVRDPEKVLSDNRRLGSDLAAAKKELKAATSRLADMEKANMSEVERQLAEARVGGAEDERAKWLPVVRDLTLTKAAVGKLIEPSVAGKLLADRDIDFTDTEAVDKAIDTLLEEYPTLALSAQGQHRPAFDQGARNGSAPAPKTMNDELLDMLGVQRGPRR